MPNPLTDLELLEAHALNLTTAERSHLLERLISSLDVDEQTEREWDQLADQREAELAAGKATPVPVADALARIRSRSTP